MLGERILLVQCTLFMIDRSSTRLKPKECTAVTVGGRIISLVARKFVGGSIIILKLCFPVFNDCVAA